MCQEQQSSMQVRIVSLNNCAAWSRVAALQQLTLCSVQSRCSAAAWSRVATPQQLRSLRCNKTLTWVKKMNIVIFKKCLPGSCVGPAPAAPSSKLQAHSKLQARSRSKPAPSSKLAPAQRLWSQELWRWSEGGGVGRWQVGGGKILGQRRGEKKKSGQGGWDFRSSEKRPQRAHPQLVHWWLLIHSSLHKGLYQ